MGLKKTTKRRIGLAILAFVLLALALLAWPREDLLLSKIGINEPMKVRRGLDLQGGVELVYEAQMQQVQGQSNSDEILNNVQKVVERRVNPGGASEVAVRTAAGNRIVVELPGIDDPEEAKQLIGKTAQLNFYELSQTDPTAEGGQGITPTEINGQDIQRATVDFQQTGGAPIVNLEFKSGESTQQFAELTTRLSQNGGSLVTLLDEQVVFGPATVAQPITDGRSQLSGDFDVKEAKEIAALLNAGALPVPVEIVAQRVVGPTLGAESIKHSLLAAIIGLLSVSAFLLIYYRWAGVMAIISLVFYTLCMLVLFKLSVFTPYVLVLTLAGIAGFILSIAVAVDTNILVFERVKEELKKGSIAPLAFEDGFKHAWTSIRDANAATLISCGILYYFGTPVIKGFALTLGIGVLFNLLAAQSVTKLLMRSLVRSKLIEKTGWISQQSGSNK